MNLLKWTPVIVVVVIVLSLAILAIWVDTTSPYTKYACTGEFMTLRLFDNYTCNDCCFINIDGFYEFKFPNWVWNNEKITISTSKLVVKHP